MKHYSVMKNESITALNLKSDSIVIDATLGYAGDSSEILKNIPDGYLYAFDQDIDAINYSDDFLKQYGSNYELIHSNFVNMKEIMEDKGIDNVDAILFDLGVSSPQIDEVERGFSFQGDATLDMRMNQDDEVSAYEVVNDYKQDDLTNIFYKYGEEKLSKPIAKKIVEMRPIKTTKELVKVINMAVGDKYFNLHHPERRIFQAIRIEVNHELDVLEKVLPDAIDMLKSNGRLAVISFHSLEDRIVKQVFKKYSEVEELYRGLPYVPEEHQPKIKIINKKVIEAQEDELRENSRSKSAKLRIVERI